MAERLKIVMTWSTIAEKVRHNLYNPTKKDGKYFCDECHQSFYTRDKLLVHDCLVAK